MTAFERYAVKTSKKANMHNPTGRPDPLAQCTLGAQEVTRNGSIDSRMLSTTAASPCQTDPRRETASTNSPAHLLAVSHIRSLPRAYTSLLWRWYHKICTYLKYHKQVEQDFCRYVRSYSFRSLRPSTLSTFCKICVRIAREGVDLEMFVA